MKRLICAFACVVSFGPAALSDTTTFTAASGNWNVSGNWDNGVPTEADRAVIPSGKTCEITTSVVADTIEVYGTLNISSGTTGSLTLDNDDDNIVADPDHSLIDGTVEIGVRGFLNFVENDHAVQGSGDINGTFGTSAVIEIADDVKLTNRLSTGAKGIHGTLIIRSPANEVGIFRNEGVVHADDSANYIDLAANLTVEDHDTVSHAKWLMTAGRLRFYTESTSLNGDFSLAACGKLDCEENVKTCGQLTYVSGQIVVNSTTFQYAVVDDRAACGNPGTVTGTASCSNPWTVSSTTSECNCSGGPGGGE